jgi:hypothetical protein
MEKYHKDTKYGKHQKTLTKLVEDVHWIIGKAMNETGIQSIRILEEMTNHYFLAKKHFELKQSIANIDTFLLLFNPYTKYDLCRYWQVLEGQGYDPVVEYNKGLELFDMHFSPKPEDLFTIILQISRFLKEFSDFETKNTPQFRHPFIRGKIVEKRESNDDDFNQIFDEDFKSQSKQGQSGTGMFKKKQSPTTQKSGKKIFP